MSTVGYAGCHIGASAACRPGLTANQQYRLETVSWIGRNAAFDFLLRSAFSDAARLIVVPSASVRGYGKSVQERRRGDNGVHAPSQGRMDLIPPDAGRAMYLPVAEVPAGARRLSPIDGANWCRSAHPKRWPGASPPWKAQRAAAIRLQTTRNGTSTPDPAGRSEATVEAMTSKRACRRESAGK